MLSLRMDRPFSHNCCDNYDRIQGDCGGRVTAENEDNAMRSRIDKVTYASGPWPRKRLHPGVTLSSLRLPGLPKSLGSTYLYPSPALEQSTWDGLTVVTAGIVQTNVVC